MGRRPGAAARAAPPVHLLGEHLAGPRPVVADRPDEPQPDEHRHEQAQDRDLVGTAPRAIEEQEEDQRRTAVWPMTWLALADEPVQAEELADPSGGESRTIRTRSATWTPPSRSRGSPRRPGTREPGRPEPDRDTADDEADRPRAEHPDSVRLGPPVHQPAPDEAHRDRDERQRQQDEVRLSSSDTPRPSPSRRS